MDSSINLEETSTANAAMFSTPLKNSLKFHQSAPAHKLETLASSWNNKNKSGTTTNTYAAVNSLDSKNVEHHQLYKLQHHNNPSQAEVVMTSETKTSVIANLKMVATLASLSIKEAVSTKSLEDKVKSLPLFKTVTVPSLLVS